MILLKMNLDKLLLISGNDIPFPKAQAIIHQPRVKEIAYMGEKNFHLGSHLITFDKKMLSDKDKIGLEDQSNFHIFMTVMNDFSGNTHRNEALMVLTLLFPQYEIKIDKDKILLQSENFSSTLNEDNFYLFQDILNQIFCFESSSDDYDPADDLAKKVADKIKKGKERKAKQKEGQVVKFDIYKKFATTLSIGMNIDINTILDYTIYQLSESYNKYIEKVNFDTYIKAKLAGAQDLEEVKNWMED